MAKQTQALMRNVLAMSDEHWKSLRRNRIGGSTAGAQKSKKRKKRANHKRAVTIRRKPDSGFPHVGEFSILTVTNGDKLLTRLNRTQMLVEVSGRIIGEYPDNHALPAVLAKTACHVRGQIPADALSVMDREHVKRREFSVHTKRTGALGATRGESHDSILS